PTTRIYPLSLHDALPISVLFPDDGCDGDGGVTGRGRDGDAGRQREPGDRVDHAGGAGEGTAIRDPGRRTNGRRGDGDRYHCLRKDRKSTRLNSSHVAISY